MGLKWNDTTERMILIKFLEQNLLIKLDIDVALASWPSDLEAPTERGIKDRFNLIKKQIRESRVASSLGQGGLSSSHNTPQSAPRTPKSNLIKRIKTELDPDTIDADQEEGTISKESKSNKLTKGLFGTSVKARPQFAKSNPQSTSKSLSGQKRKNRGSDEDSMSEGEETEDSFTSANEAIGTAHGKSPSEGRRNLPRRSKSTTPAAYQVDVESAASETEADEHDDERDEHKNKKAKIRKSGKRSQKNAIAIEKNDTGSDDSFDPVTNRTLEKDGNKKRRATWQERIAMVDGGIVDDDDDDQA